ncbi:MAG TPA: bifunctional 4-hydroxy-2-oxoglutarate aldolase/2-dehydro-3-deoxy-phosphogluconate aldolase [bacterium]|nr:bifunctional 4-hydroxy-2-oxoglutarate aldolase/2-dehydro-3-deoxy-phosphogluconate aldolase [bacterium]
MHRSQKIFEVLTTRRLIAFLAPQTVEDCVRAYETLAPMGIVLEIAFRTAAALEGIRATVEKHPDALVLAGTVMTSKQADAAVRAGVAGIISADYVPSVVEACVGADVMCVPGGLGDAGKQLVQKAELYGCDFEALREKYPYQWIYKLFPATTENLNFVSLSKAWKAAFKGLRMVYTGGISLQNLGGLAAQDPEGIFCGSAVTRRIDDPGKMKEEAGRWLDIIRGSAPPVTA